MSDYEWQVPWAKFTPRWGHPWHSMCSYLGAFPASLARSFLYMLSDEGDIVLDPFVGRGTTLLEARLGGRTPLGSDLNPIAVALTVAKNASVTLDEVVARIDELEEKFDSVLYAPEAQAQAEDIKLIYHHRTLAQLCYLRARLTTSDHSVDQFLVGLVLGVMHGNERDNGTSAYASISMPNTFSMSADYVRRFVETRRLPRVERNVFDLLRGKVQRLWRRQEDFKTTGCVVRADAKKLTTVSEFSDYAGQVDLVLTSPPYLDVVNYARQNWIRMWFLGGDPEEVSTELDDNLTLGEWLDFAEHSVAECKRMLKPGGRVVLVIGDVAKSGNSVISLARELTRRLLHDGLFEYVGFITDRLPTADKTTRIWKETKGRATAVDRILVLADEEPAFRSDRLGLALFGDRSADIPPVDAKRLSESARAFVG